MTIRKSPNRSRKTQKSPLSAELETQLNLLRWNELDPDFIRTRLEEAICEIGKYLPDGDFEVQRWFKLLHANQYTMGFMQGLTAYRRALDTTERLSDQSMSYVLQCVSESDTVDTFLANHGQELIPSFQEGRADWTWLRDLKLRKLQPSWNDAARKTIPKTRKAFLDQFRRLKEHVDELATANDLIKRTNSLMQRRKAKVAALGRRKSVD